jgi:hypothetical protein
VMPVVMLVSNNTFWRQHLVLLKKISNALVINKVLFHAKKIRVSPRIVDATINTIGHELIESLNPSLCGALFVYNLRAPSVPIPSLHAAASLITQTRCPS